MPKHIIQGPNNCSSHQFPNEICYEIYSAKQQRLHSALGGPKKLFELYAMQLYVLETWSVVTEQQHNILYSKPALSQWVIFCILISLECICWSMVIVFIMEQQNSRTIVTTKPNWYVNITLKCMCWKHGKTVQHFV